MLRIRDWKAEGRVSTRGIGGALYRTVWRMRKLAKARRWMHQVTGRKRWLRPHGTEWRLVGLGPGLNTAYH
eukprot:5691295-Lingulodinium_polyedra.AAC.1